jgi:Domain of unknown function (DUF4276)
VSVEHLEIMVEEPSMEAALRALLPTMVGDLSFQIYPHLCKDDLLQQLPKRLRGYASWLPSNYRILIVVDRDDDDCQELKRRLEGFAAESGLVTRSAAGGKRYQVVNRIVIEELEAWYFGDWEAVRAAYPRVSPTLPKQEKYRHPDAIVGGTWESFERVLQRAGYFKGGLPKVEVARQIAPHLNPARSRSSSFRCLCSTLAEISGEP